MKKITFTKFGAGYRCYVPELRTTYTLKKDAEGWWVTSANGTPIMWNKGTLTDTKREVAKAIMERLNQQEGVVA